MITRITADAIVLAHLAFILFVAVGGLFVLRWPRLAWAHLPAVIWGALVELAGWICPLTPLENRLRAAAGDSAYAGGFIDRYIMPIVYPPGLSRSFQIALGCAVIILNVLIYGLAFTRRLRSTKGIG
jgi:hypothetical protein